MSVDVESSRRTTSARCVACKQTFSAGDLVMRADVSLFHPTCFSCCICRRRLNRGQQFALVDAGRILCRADYERLHAQTQPAVATAATTAAVRDERCIDASGDSDELRPGHGDVDVCANPATKGGEDVSVQSTCAARSLCRNRWRTRKLIHCVQEDSVGGVCSGCAETLQYSADHFGGDGSNSSSTPRQKRLRTSFKHHQLRVLKTYFVLNHNPDAKDLKQLSQKTGLGKRILQTVIMSTDKYSERAVCCATQVWFQNARAKYRRSLQRDEKTSDDQWTSSSASNVVAARTAVSSLSETETQRSCCTIAMVTSSVSSSSIYSDLQQNTGSCSD